MTGTEADLRKLKKKDIKQKLIEMGKRESELALLSRWDMCKQLRWNANQNEENQIYARGVRYDSKK